jgi:hypothetical protein
MGDKKQFAIPEKQQQQQRQFHPRTIWKPFETENEVMEVKEVTIEALKEEAWREHLMMPMFTTQAVCSYCRDSNSARCLCAKTRFFLNLNIYPTPKMRLFQRRKNAQAIVTQAIDIIAKITQIDEISYHDLDVPNLRALIGRYSPMTM